MPAACCITSFTLLLPWSSICWRLTTVTVCGVSRSTRFSPVADADGPAVYVPVPSVRASPRALAVTVTAASVAGPPGAGAAVGMARSA
ncbi:hypothetical protein D3C78_1146950 [compost metagenome]